MEEMMPSESKEEQRGWPRWLMATIVCVLVAMVAALLFLPVVSRAQPPSRANCINNLKQLCLAVAMYGDANGGRCPMDSAKPTLVGSMQLLSNVVMRATILHCPDDPRPGARAEADFKKLTTLNVSYSYVPNLKWQDKPDSPLIMDRIYTTSKGSAWPSNGNHGDEGGNVGFIDGHVAWQTTLPAALKDKDGKEVVLSP
jgi:prepilin-type processing-associated H-X9-DG protein